MSKQTNAFQQLIHYIYEKIENDNATVTESAMLFEQNVDEKIPREVDVLIEKTINGKQVRIAVECRDREVKDDIQWVDCLIGKYLNLEVQKVIAVSNSGYSKSAQLKAAANGIELKTLQEALDIDFNNEFIKLGIVTIANNFKLKQVTFEFLKPFKDKPTPQLQVFKDENQISTLDELVSFCFEEGTKKKLIPYMNKNFLDIFKTRADLNKFALIEHKIPINKLFVQALDGDLYELSALIITVVGKPTVNKIEIRHRTYESTLITEGKTNADEFDKIHTIYAVQTTKSKEVKTFVKSKKKRSP